MAKLSVTLATLQTYISRLKYVCTLHTIGIALTVLTIKSGLGKYRVNCSWLSSWIAGVSQLQFKTCEKSSKQAHLEFKVSLHI